MKKIANNVLFLWGIMLGYMLLFPNYAMAQETVTQQWSRALEKHKYSTADKLLIQHGWEIVNLSSVTTEDMNNYIAHVEKCHSNIHLYLDSLYVGLGEMYASVGNMMINFQSYAAAEENFQKSAQCYRGRLELGDDRMRALAVLRCNLYYAWGNQRKLLEAYDDALLVYEQIKGRYSDEYFRVLNFKSGISVDLRYYTMADSSYQECLQIADSLYGQSSTEYARILSNWAVLKYEIGNMQEAINMLMKSNNIRLQLSDAPLEDIASTALNIASVYQKMEQFNNADLFYGQALNLFQQQKDSVHLVTVLNNHASMLNLQGDYTRAIRLLGQAEGIARKKHMTGTEVFVAVLKNMAIAFSNGGFHQSAILYQKLVLEYMQQNGAESTPRYYLECAKLAQEYAYLGMKDSASYFMKKSWSNLQLCSNITPLELESAYNTIGGLAGYLKDYNFAMSCYEKSREVIRQMYGDSTHHESIVLSAEAYTLHEMGNNRDALSKYKQYLDIERKQVNQQLLLLEEERREKYWELRGSVSFAELPALCVDVYDSLPESANLFYDNALFSKQILLTALKDNALKTTYWQQIQSKLSQHQFAIEYFRYYDKEKHAYWYAAAMINSQDKHPMLRRLCSENHLMEYQTLATSKLYSTPRLYSMVVSIFDSYWSPGDTIFFSADGILNQFNIECCPTPSGERMIEKYHIVRLSSTRNLVYPPIEKNVYTAAVYGGILYNLDISTLYNESVKYLSYNLQRDLSINNEDRGSVKYLPGTLIEAESISHILMDNNISTSLHTAASANEESLLSLSSSNTELLHIGTHGFYWTDSTAQNQLFFQDEILNKKRKNYSSFIDPLDRCGLLFAGANTALSGHSKDLPEGVQDGILTAKEISLMNLTDCDLVVLSACETAKGDITSDGVFGLQRAFKMAGVQTIIMSLWPVNDNATQMLMTEFYTNWIERKQSKRDAFKNAQNTVRYAVDKDGDRMYEDPVYWAGFIMLD